MDNIIIEPILNIVNVIKEEILIEYTIEVNPVYSGIQGIQGIQGVNGIDGIDGINGVDGIDGEDLTLSDFNTASEATVINQTDEFIIKQDNEWKRSDYSLVAPDASTTKRGFINTITQAFAGAKSFNNLIWAKATPTNTVDTNLGSIGIGTDGSNPLFSFRLDASGNLKLDKIYNSVFSNVLSVNRETGLFSLGVNAGYNNTVSYIGLIGGSYAGQNNTGSYIGLIGGYYAGQNNTGSQIGLIGGSYAGQNNTGSYIGLIGGNSAGYNNTGSYIGLIGGYYAGLNNTGSQIGLIGGSYAGQNNTGSQIGLIGGSYAGQNNTGSYIGLIGGYYAGYNNTGSGIISIGNDTLKYNQKNNNIAIGNNSYSSFLDNVDGNKTFDNTNIDITTDRVTITGHGFGSNGEWINVKYTQGTSAITGLVNNSIYQVKIINANTISFRELISGTTYHGIDITNAGTGTGHIITPQFAYENTISLGSNTQPTKSNQVVLGNSSVTEILIGANLAIDKNAIVNAADGTQLYVRLINGVKTITI